MPRNALGRGLSALIREPEQPAASRRQPPVPAARDSSGGSGSGPALAPSDGLLQVDIDLIDPSPLPAAHTLPRRGARRAVALDSASGIVQPLVVRRIGTRYQLIAGERRWRAAQRASLPRVPAIVRDVPRRDGARDDAG